MILKIVSLFLIGMMVLGMFGKLRLPKRGKKTAQKCGKCGSHIIGGGPCACERRG